MPVASLPVPWTTIRKAAEAGADFTLLAGKYGVERNTISQRCRREQWLTPRRVMEKLEMQNAVKAAIRGDGKQATVDIEEIVADPSRTVALLEKERAKEKQSRDEQESLVMETWETRGNQIRDQAWLLAQKSLAPAIASGIMVTSAKEAATMIKIAREATGQFQESNAMFNVSIFGNGEETIGAIAQGQVHDVETIEDDDEWC